MRTSSLANPVALTIGVVLALLPIVGQAQPYPPEWRWRTTETAHFRIHFHEGIERVAAEVARSAEHAHETLVPIIGHTPRAKTEVVIADLVDDANGLATPLPYNTIRIYAVPPEATSELSNERDWIEALLLHEYVHILHLDTVGGFPSLADAVFGRLWFPNVFVPIWMIEGLAVAHESEDARTGRDVSSLYAMYIRAMASEGGLPSLDRISNTALDWPLGETPYVLGGRFMAWLEGVYGREAVTGFLREQGSQVWPYAPSWAGARWFRGKSFPELWADYDAHELAMARERRVLVESRPPAPFQIVSHLGALAQNPRWSPSGEFILAYHAGLDERAGLYRCAPSGKDLGRAATVDLNGTFAFVAENKALVAETEIFKEFREYDDLFLEDLAGHGRTRLTSGERATEPDLASDGTLVYVKRTGDGGMALVRRRLTGARLSEAEVLFEEPGVQVFNPRIAPDGRRIALTLHRNGRTDLALWEDGAVRTLTDDDALDLTPAWTPDGTYILWASDRTGAFDIYAFELATARVLRVTNAETGALWPDVSPDGKRLAFLTYSRAGYDVAVMSLERETWPDGSRDGEPPTPSPGQPPPLPPLSSSASRPYRAIESLKPSFWIPLLGSDAAGYDFGALTGGADALLQHIWVAQGWWSAGGRTPGYSLNYQGQWSWPALDFSSSRSVTSSPDPAGRKLSAWNIANAGATFNFDQIGRSLSARLGWSGTRYETLLSPPATYVAPNLRFQDGFLSDASLTFAYSDAREFVRSISSEEGRAATLSFDAAGKETGSDYSLRRMSGTVAQFLKVPGTRHAALLLRASGGVAHGTLGGQAPFTIGGPQLSLNPLDYLLGTLPDGSAAYLRGYAPGELGGTGFYLGTVEGRFPIAAPQLGRDTWPAFLRRVHGSVFVDAGEAFDMNGELPVAGMPANLRDTRFGVGAELGLEMVFGYSLLTDIRLGVATPLGPVFAGGRSVDLRELGEAPPARFYVIIVPLQL